MADEDDGVAAIQTLIAALKPLDEKTRLNVLDFVLKQLNIGLPKAEDKVIPRGHEFTWAVEDVPPPRSVATPHGDDIRTLAEQKKPRTVNEKVALVAYYLKNMAPDEERRDNIVSEDIGRYFVEAGFELPSAPPHMTLSNAKNAGYLNSIGPGQYKINAVGHNLVAHRLPLEGGGQSKPAKRASKKKRL